MKTIIAMAALAIGLTGCSSNAAPASVPSPTPIPTLPVLPVSTLVTDLTLPAGAVNTVFEEYRDHLENWKLSASFDATASHLDSQLPLGRDFDGLKWCTKTVVAHGGMFDRDEEIKWAWGDNTGWLTIYVEHDDDEDIRVRINRDVGPYDRSDCDAEKAAAPTPDEAFITNLGDMKGWPDRAQVIAAKRDELIKTGRTACTIQERDGEGAIATSVNVMDLYGVSGDEAGSVVVAAFDVYCPEAAS